MPRRREIPKRKILPDPVYGSQLLSKFINNLMESGKKSVAEKIVYEALEMVQSRTNSDPMEMFEKALENVAPDTEVRSKRLGGSSQQIPTLVRPERKLALAMRWIITAARKRSEKNMSVRLAGELVDATESRGNAYRKKEEAHKMADANRAYSHFRF